MKKVNVREASVTAQNYDGGGMEGEMRLTLHPQRAQSRLKSGELR